MTVRANRYGALFLGELMLANRFLANTPEDAELLQAFVQREQIGQTGSLAQKRGRTLFRPD